MIKNAFSVDLEDWYQGIEMPYASWGSYEKRVEVGMNKLLQLLSDSDTRGTFFTLGWIAEKYPKMIKLLADQGHELASHGYSHEKVYNLSQQTFREEIRKTKSTIEDLAGSQVVAYRAPFFSITVDSLWALDILREEGHTIDCSISPVKTWRYGISSAPDHIFKITDVDMIEFPVSTFNIMGKTLALGGAYFRLFPYMISEHAYKKRAAQDAFSMFYIHPWEYDQNHPYENKMEPKARFTHYHNLKKTYINTEKLLSKFNFGTVSETITNYISTSQLTELRLSELQDQKIK
jgi:polysaccharide deacetylase family protein (PEP-CTERM system associated)